MPIDRRSWLKTIGVFTGSTLFYPILSQISNKIRFASPKINARHFGDFIWGTACSAFQIEGASETDGKGLSIWDTFTRKKKNIKDKSNAKQACNFYKNFKSDILLNKNLGFKHFRFSISWARIFPSGIGHKNQAGIDFYHRVIDFCIENDQTPWVTLYHWDLPQSLQNQGGWTNRESIDWFKEYTSFCAKEYGQKVKNWIVMNEPAAFVGLGYLLGYHAPGVKNPFSFLKATHHVCLSMAEGAREIRKNVEMANIGSSFSCSSIHPISQQEKHVKAAKRMDVLLNRLFIEPCLGMGYPMDDLAGLRYIKRYIQEGDMERLKFDFDFIGLQNYFRVVARKNALVPFLQSTPVSAEKREAPHNTMGFEIYPEGMYQILKQFNNYQIKNIIITENGTCAADKIEDGTVHDQDRINYFESYLNQVLRAKNEGVPVSGYFAWSLTDNFEWSEGYTARFGLIYIDFENQKRTIKDSGYWFSAFLGSSL